jgi:hypothetical protein
MDPIPTGHERPINQQARMILARAPWWAHYPEPAKKAVLELADKEPVKWDNLLSYTDPPPDPAEGQQRMIDHRGKTFCFADGERGIVLGFASKHRCVRSDKSHRARMTKKKGGQSSYLLHFWWVQKGNEIVCVKWRTKRTRPSFT